MHVAPTPRPRHGNRHALIKLGSLLSAFVTARIEGREVFELANERTAYVLLLVVLIVIIFIDVTVYLITHFSFEFEMDASLVYDFT